MYTLREFTKTPADLARTLSRVKKIGYEAVQMSGHGPIDAKELAKMLEGEGLVCAATHVPLERMIAEPERVIEDHKLWKCKYTAIGGFFIRDRDYTPKDWGDFIAKYNAAAQKFKGSGVQLGYHNHNHELAKFNGATALQTLLDRLDRSIWFEIDTYWITAGGGDPVQWIDKVTGRIPCVHFKDMGVKSADRSVFMAEIGEGNLNWPAIIDACRRAGVEWYLIEQDICYRDPFESVEISLRNLRELGVQ
jgi:sugar phosphate isomerase/epimerase